ncbi:MAG: hypothetical protein V4697_03165 [Patescibacteria group bacterium]
MNNNNQEHRPIHILYGVIALAVVVWSVLYYQVKNAPPPVVQEDTSPPVQSGLSAEERARVMAETESATNTPQLSSAERAKIDTEIKKESGSQGLSPEERARVEQELSNN